MIAVKNVDTRKKIVGLKTLKRKIQRLKKQRKKIAFTNGCFDILHAGHVRYLEVAKKAGRVLIVGLNSDASVRKIKGPRRPIIPQRQRASLVAALDCVDYVTIFSEETPYKTINHLKPNILIKGADWKNKEVVGEDIVRSSGGKVELIKYIPGLSTTKIITTIKRKCGKSK